METDSANSDSSPFPSKRLKTTTDDCRSESEPKPQTHCAICFVGGGGGDDDDDEKPTRGEIDCCDHHFCFLCIMEWARTESRCPLCRRRFTSIRRPPKAGVFACERLITIPIRDQACYAAGSSDPYAEVSCNVCRGTGDDCLLLLCDLCDSASHTYCVGLGFTVPEGDWFCHDCTLSRAERANCKKETEEDIGRELTGLVAEKSPPLVSSCSKRPTSLVPDRKASASKEVTRQDTKNLITGLSKKKSTVSSTRTLGRCRSVHGRIRAIRKNWKALQTGSLSFSAPVSHRPFHHGQKHETKAVTQHRSTQVESSSSASCSQSKDQVGSGLYDIDRAWKMMDMAISKQFGRGKTITLQSSKVPCSEASASKEMAKANSNFVTKSQQINYNSLGRTESPSFKGAETKKSQFLELDKEKRHRVIINKAAKCTTTLSTKCSCKLSENSLSENITCVGDNNCQEHRSTWFQEIMNQDSYGVASGRDGLASSVRQVVSDSFNVRSELSASSSVVDVPKRNITSKNKDTRHDAAKSKIQSLVKHNLKLLTKEKRLGVDLFKEIARFATHTILAACGLEHHKKYGAYSAPSSVLCSHIQLSHESPKSNLMPKYCEPCFNSFVKDVVTSIMFERVGCARPS